MVGEAEKTGERSEKTKTGGQGCLNKNQGVNDKKPRRPRPEILIKPGGGENFGNFALLRNITGVPGKLGAGGGQKA